MKLISGHIVQAPGLLADAQVLGLKGLGLLGFLSPVLSEPSHTHMGRTHVSADVAVHAC